MSELSSEYEQEALVGLRMPISIEIDNTIVVRRIGIDDLDFLTELTSDSSVSSFIPWARNLNNKQDIERILNRFELEWQNGISARYIICDEGKSIGYFGIWPDRVKGVFQTGSALLPSARGKGIINLVREEIISILKVTYGATALAAYVDLHNEASLAMIKKAGYQPTDEYDQGEMRFIRYL